ncbi:MAG: hypothetical protein M1814_005785 [Vezdaea aestivalis]|nr:MAG: hypothetical protein M1814_005785 [Vezdaea aestivalis]
MRLPDSISAMQAPEPSAVTIQVGSCQSNRKRKRARTNLACPVRKSPRLKKTLMEDCEAEVPAKHIKRQYKRLRQPVHLPSPPPSQPPKQNIQRKRRLSTEDSYNRIHKISRASEGSSRVDPQIQITNPVENWILTGNWPSNFTKGAITMSDIQSKVLSKRKPSSAHRSDLRRQRAKHGIFMRQSECLLSKSEDFCDELLASKYQYISCVGYPEDKFLAVLTGLLFTNETKIQRDLMPRIVPSAEHLRFHGEPGLDSIAEEANTIWFRCEPMGSSIPMPDAGLNPEIFTDAETRKLQTIQALDDLFCFRLTGDQTLLRAQSQNINSGSIAVNAIIELYQAAFREKEPERIEALYGEVLTFSVSHDHDMVRLWGHYAVMKNSLEFYYHEISVFSLSNRKGQDRNQGYNFTRNVYTEFVPKHLKRIRDAVKELQDPGSNDDALSSGLSFGTSNISVGGRRTQQSQDNQFKVPGEPASSTKAEVSERQREEEIKNLQGQIRDLRDLLKSKT